MVEEAGFEPAKPVRAAILQTAPISHSGTPPWATIVNRIPEAREGIRTRQPTDYKSVALPLRHSGSILPRLLLGIENTRCE